MSVLVVGMSHRSAPVSVLEQVSMTDEACSATTRALLDRPSLTEAMIVSTCNSGWKLSPQEANEWMTENMFKKYPKGDLKDTTAQ